MKTLLCWCFVIFLPLNLMAQDVAALRKERDKLQKRGMWRETVDFFIRALPRGTHSLRYELRAEAPGNYKALPATAKAMYAPELRGNSDDIRLMVE